MALEYEWNGKGCNQPCGNPREHSANKKNRLSTRFRKQNCLCFCESRAMNCLMKPSEARVSESVSQSRPRTSTCGSGDPGGFRSSCKRIRERPIVKQIQQILSIDQNNYTTLTWVAVLLKLSRLSMNWLHVIFG